MLSAFLKENILVYWQNITSLDLRGLMVFRILLGLFLLCDLWVRSVHLGLFYSNQGVYLVEEMPYRWMSIYGWSGSVLWVQLLFAVTAVLSALLILGIRSRVVLALLFYLVISLHLRNAAVNNAADQWLRYILLMSIFLPLGKGSVTVFNERKICKNFSYNISNIWTFLFYLQIVLVYGIAGFSKNNDIWNSGLGIQYAMHLHSYAKPTAQWLLGYPGLMQLFNYGTLALERFGWLLLFIPVKRGLLRSVLVTVYIVFHFGLFLFMELGTFPWLAMIVWIALLPSPFWDMFWKRQHIDGSGSMNGLQKLTIPNYFFQGVFAFMVFVLLLYANLRKAKWFTTVTALEVVVNSTGLTQGWSLFSGPKKSDGWLVLQANLANGDSVDLISPNHHLSWKRPECYAVNFENHRIRKFIKNIRKGRSVMRTRYSKRLRDGWNISHSSEEQIVSLEMYYLEEKILAQGGYAKVEKRKRNLLNRILNDES